MYALTTLHDVAWHGPTADAWFRGGPGVITVSEAAAPNWLVATTPEEAIGRAAQDLRWVRRAPDIVDELGMYLYRVADLALQGDPRVKEIAATIFGNWSTLTSSDLPALYLINAAIRDRISHWQYVHRHHWVLAAAARLRNETGWHCSLAVGPSGDQYILAKWQPDRPLLPVALPDEHVTPELLYDAALRLAAAEVPARCEGYRIPTDGDPCAAVLDHCQLTAAERRLLMWARRLHPASAAPEYDGIVARHAVRVEGEIWRSIRR